MSIIIPDYLSFSPYLPVSQTNGLKGILKSQVKRAFVKQKLLTRTDAAEGYLYTPVKSGSLSTISERWLLVVTPSLLTALQLLPEPTLETKGNGEVEKGIDAIISFQETIDGKFAIAKLNLFPSAKEEARKDSSFFSSL